MVRIGSVDGKRLDLRTVVAGVFTLVVMVGSISIGGATTGTGPDDGERVTEIDSCTTIDEPGTYQLADSIENSTAGVCIHVRASDVHFDGGGHVIDGSVTRQAILERLPPAGPAPTDGVGIGVNLDGGSVSNVTVTNVSTTDWFYGVFVRGADDATVREMTSTTSGIGVLVDSATDATVERTNGSNNVIAGVSVRESGDQNGATVVNTTAVENGRYGVLLYDSARSTVRNVTATGNEFVGLEVVNSSHSTVRNVTATGNDFRGFGVDALPGNAARNVTVADSDFGRNGYIGMAVFATADSTFANVSVAGTRGTLPPERSPPVPSAGVVLDFGSAANDLFEVDARNQAEWAYVALNSGPNTVEDLRTDAVPVSFEGQNLALGATGTVSENPFEGTTTRADGVTVTNTSPDGFIDLQIRWENDRSTNETESLSRSSLRLVREPV